MAEREKLERAEREQLKQVIKASLAEVRTLFWRVELKLHGHRVRPRR